MEIKVLGTGCCSKCATLTRNAEDAVKAMGINASVEEVTDIEKIISYGIMRTPALAVVETNGRNVCGSKSKSVADPSDTVLLRVANGKGR